MKRAMDVLSRALALLEEDRCHQPHKVVLRKAEQVTAEECGRFNALFAWMEGPRPAVGMKWIGSFPANRSKGLPRASALIILNSPDSGLPVAVMDGTLISAVRTGAITALGGRYLAPRGTRKIGMIGAGVQAHTQVLGLMTALPQIEQIAVVNRCSEQAETLAEDCRSRWNAPVNPVSTIREALADADVALTVTTSLEPLMKREHIKPGALTIQLSGHECEFEVIQECQKIVVDNWEGVKHRGIISPAVMHSQGLLRDRDIYANLGELVLGRKPGRESDQERIHFAHMGMGIADVALGWEVYREASNHGLGQYLKLWEEPLWV
jgi:N-[(2S)-2-amino-2-carboxyethyl]-L-glutamate dehydrogenase